MSHCLRRTRHLRILLEDRTFARSMCVGGQCIYPLNHRAGSHWGSSLIPSRAAHMGHIVMSEYGLLAMWARVHSRQPRGRRPVSAPGAHVHSLV